MVCVCRLTAEKVRVDWHGPREEEEEEEEEEVTHIFLLFSLPPQISFHLGPFTRSWQGDKYDIIFYSFRINLLASNDQTFLANSARPRREMQLLKLSGNPAFLLPSLSIPPPGGICLLRYLFLRHFLEAGGGRGMKYLRLGIRPAKGRKCDIFIA